MNKYLIYYFFLVFSFTANAEDEVVGSSSAPLIVGNRIYITNATSKRQYFDVRPTNGRWSTYSLNSGKKITIECNQCVAEKFDFKMKTGAKVVNYTLQETTRHEIAWNDRKQLWDIFRVE